MIIWFIKIFFVAFFVYSFHFFLITSASTRSLPFLFFIVPIFGQYVPLILPIFLKIFLVFPFCCFPLFLCIVHWRRFFCFSLLFVGTQPLVWCTFPFLPWFSLLFSLQLFGKPPQTTTLPSCYFYPLGWFLSWLPTQVLWTSVHSSSGISFHLVQTFSHVWLLVTPCMPGFPVHHQLLKLAQTHPCSVVMPSNHLILCHPLCLLISIFPSIRVFSNESVLCNRWPKYWSFSFSISLSNEYSGLISFRMDWLDLLVVQGTLESSPTPQFKSTSSLVLSFLYSPTFTSIHDYWKNHSLD